MNPGDWLLIGVVALIVFGPKRLPEVARELREALVELRNNRRGSGPGGPAAA